MKQSVLMNIADDTASNQHARRFGGLARLYGDTGLSQLMTAHICVIGIGGVGSWVVESLARSAVGAITMIDMDVVATSNINRQLVATLDNLGRDKVAVMRDRITQINPACQVTLIDDFINPDNLQAHLGPGFSFVIDCIDDYRTKAALISHCKNHKINILTVGGAGGQSNPGKVRQTDLSKTQHDVLLAKTRKLLRQDYGFARNPKRIFSVPCVYSDEQLMFPDGAGGISAQRPNTTSSKLAENSGPKHNALGCAGGLGSASHVTATFAQHACGYVLNHIATVN